MSYFSYDDPYMDDEFNEQLDSGDENWDSYPDNEEIPERIEWLDDVDGGDLDDYGFENDYDEFDEDDF